MNFSRLHKHKNPNIVMKHTVHVVGCAHVLPFSHLGIDYTRENGVNSSHHNTRECNELCNEL